MSQGLFFSFSLILVYFKNISLFLNYSLWMLLKALQCYDEHLSQSFKQNFTQEGPNLCHKGFL